MAKRIVMESRGVRYHQVQKAVQDFIDSEFISCTVGNCSWMEWRDKRVCQFSFQRAIGNLGYEGRVTVRFGAKGEIMLWNADLGEKKKRSRKSQML